LKEAYYIELKKKLRHQKYKAYQI